ncbi:vesicle-associated protein 1-2-like isoform X1 [Populus nigra]|uniref:vesicle-associated protein 1-2-like isoform X1 n=1 Tax=Populus nigra TaxID=3691 RepID=UPI002B2745E9|nr:vesicle-associated protein 1-2-like isoform X1 [Populus nigra]XP_061970491.1 vesicle-associated protein 1-2-like isoform X1 [Populus nigra]XP_061970492.1 vesicle-associated protein 1-2-like isoform X1 [Populus nigra]XP_061970493.1 vesicle-associated protein 1-2-like isoform X1 [Populus nigra]
MTQLLEIQPKELKFVFEVKKQSSCSIRLTNNAPHNVAFKVKTTSPKKYSVRPNVGVIDPKSTCEFIVTMQSQKEAPPDMVCKDKFLIQSTVVPVGTTEKDITSSTFAKNDNKHIEEVKMRVALISSPESFVPTPINGVFKQGPFFEPSVLKDSVPNRVEILNPPQIKQGPFLEPSVLNDSVLNRVEIITPPQTYQVAKDAEFKMTNGHESNTSEDVELKPEKDVIHGQESKLSDDTDWVPVIDIVNEKVLKLAQDEELKQDKDAISNEHSKPAPDMESPSLNEEIITANAVELKLASDIDEMKSKLHVLESKLNETESTISKLTEEKRQSSQERKILQEELDFLRSRTSVKRVYVGFPRLFVVMIALISIELGYLLHS